MNNNEIIEIIEKLSRILKEVDLQESTELAINTKIEELLDSINIKTTEI